MITYTEASIKQRFAEKHELCHGPRWFDYKQTRPSLDRPVLLFPHMVCICNLAEDKKKCLMHDNHNFGTIFLLFEPARRHCWNDPIKGRECVRVPSIQGIRNPFIFPYLNFVFFTQSQTRLKVSIHEERKTNPRIVIDATNRWWHVPTHEIVRTRARFKNRKIIQPTDGHTGIFPILTLRENCKKKKKKGRREERTSLLRWTNCISHAKIKYIFNYKTKEKIKIKRETSVPQRKGRGVTAGNSIKQIRKMVGIPSGEEKKR